MPKQPAVVIIARHGARLDQASREWHLTSPTPYDPPLTYGGWMQSRALGARIASLLEARHNEVAEHPPISETIGESWTQEQEEHLAKKRKRGHRVIIHSSPFTRCVQTSIAISAGIGQYEKKRDPNTVQPVAEIVEGDEVQDEISTSNTSNSRQHGDHPVPAGATGQAPLVPTLLRLDAFLGEWLCPAYFENILPPPSSATMVAGAKADLLRPAEHITGSDMLRRTPAFGSPVLGAIHGSNTPPSGEKNVLRAIAAAAGHSLRKLPKQMETREEDLPFYIPPTPNYAISSSQPIPAGYVAHARDACTKVELQWDSMRPPLDWGDGGEYGDDWSTMHRRVRTGLQRMLLWYGLEELHAKCDAESHDDENDDLDTVLVLVTHGAGCNAMIGAMTGQPVLIDVGTSSLTMAVRKDGNDVATSPVSATRVRRKSVDLGIADEYEMKMIAAREHIHGTLTPFGFNSPRHRRSPTVPTQKTPTTELPDAFSIGDSLSAWKPATSSVPSRSASQRTHLDVPMPRFATGLWRSRASSPHDDSDDTSESDVFPNFQPTLQPSPSRPLVVEAVKKQDFGHEDPSPSLFQSPVNGAVQEGLWSNSPTFPNTPSRRWTVIDHA